MSTPYLGSVRNGMPPGVADEAAKEAGKAPSGGAGERRVSFVAWFLLLSLASVSAVSITSAYLLSRFVVRRQTI